MGLLDNLVYGFGIAFTPENLLFCLIGVMIGEIIGILPGLGPITTIAVLLPFTYSLSPIPALMMLAGIYYGSQFGGAITSILLNSPGETSAIITAIDGYPMAKMGQAGKALAIAAISSFTGGMLGSIALTVLSPVIVKLVTYFAAPEYLALMIFALAAISGFAEETSFAKSMFGIAFGLALSTIGVDMVTSVRRFTFGNYNLYEGISFMVLAIGMFAFVEVLKNLNRVDSDFKPKPYAVSDKISLNKKDFRFILPTIIRSTISGFFIGVLPGVGSTTSTPLAYMTEKKIAGKDGKFGKGDPRGVAAGESSNNACAMGAIVPLLTMGIPGSATTAILLTAFMILGVQPGPLLFTRNPDLVWGLIASFFIGNVLLLIINLPLVKFFSKMVYIPNDVLFMSVLLLSVVGVFSDNMRLFDAWVMVIFGVIGLLFIKIGIPITPVLISLLLGDMIETNLARSVIITGRSFGAFFSRPIVLVFIAASVAVLVLPMLNRRKRRQRDKMAEGIK